MWSARAGRSRARHASQRRRSRAPPASVPQRIVLVTPAMRGDLARAQGSGLHRLSDQAGTRGFAGGTLLATTTRSMPARRWSCRNRRARRCRAAALSILVAEDNEINALLARALLVKLGHRPTMAGDGAAAIDCWLAARAAGTPLRSHAHGPAHARHGRPGSDPPHPRKRSGERNAAHADPGADRQCVRRRPRRLPRRRHGRLSGQAARPRAAWPRRWRMPARQHSRHSSARRRRP